MQVLPAASPLLHPVPITDVNGSLWISCFLLLHKRVFHKDWPVRGGTLGGDLYLESLFVCPSGVEVSFSSVPEVPSREEVVHEKALLETRYLVFRVPLKKSHL